MAATDEPEWAAICAEIAAAGYSAVEIWAAHCDPRVATETHARRVRAIMDDYGLTPIGYAGALTEASARVCQWLGIPVANEGFWGTGLAETRRVVAATGSVEELRIVIGGGDTLIGLCVDTGWLGTNAIEAHWRRRSRHAGAHCTRDRTLAPSLSGLGDSSLRRSGHRRATGY